MFKSTHPELAPAPLTPAPLASAPLAPASTSKVGQALSPANPRPSQLVGQPILAAAGFQPASFVSTLLIACLAPALLHSQTLNFQNSPRVHELIRAGNLYLSLQDALALVIENNLDVELQRYSLPVAATDLLRTQGGGVARGLSYILAEVPVGVGGPLSPERRPTAFGCSGNCRLPIRVRPPRPSRSRRRSSSTRGRQ